MRRNNNRYRKPGGGTKRPPAAQRPPSANAISVEGIVVDTLPNAMFTVQVANDHQVLATLCGKMRIRYIRVSQGDRVSLELSPYDLSRGRITFRHR